MKSLPPRAILPLDESDIVEAVTCESLRQIGEKSKGITPADAVSVQYLSTFVGQLISGTLTESRSRIPQSPYVTDYLETGDYQTAGDTAVYGYLFLQEKRRQQLSSTDYLHMASQSYFRWYGRRPTSIGYLLAERVAQYLPTMQGALKKVFPEVAPSHLRLI
jgi:hypothetical protein